MPVCVFLSVIFQNQDLPENVALVLGVGEVVNWGLCCKPERMVDSAVARLGVIL